MGLMLEDSILAWIGPWALGVDAWTCHESPPIWETVFLIELLKTTLIAKCLISATASPSDFSEDSPVFTESGPKTHFSTTTDISNTKVSPTSLPEDSIQVPCS